MQNALGTKFVTRGIQLFFYDERPLFTERFRHKLIQFLSIRNQIFVSKMEEEKFANTMIES